MASGLLLGGGLIVAVGALLTTVHTFDGSPLGSVHAAVWVVLLPAVVALATSQRRPLLGLGLCAGGGLVAVGRLLSDLALLTDPDSAVRPELFYELSTRAQPFTAAAGSGVAVAGDVVLVIAGVVAARALADRLAPSSTPIFDRSPADPAAGSGQGPQLLAQAWAAEATSTTIPVPSVAAGPAARNNGLIVLGFVGVLLLLAGSLGLPYRGGYLAARYLPPELGLAGIGGALAVALVATVAVLVAAALARRLAAALLGGVALAAAVPLLTALVVRAAHAPVELTASVPLGLAGAVVLAAAGLLGNGAPLVEEDDVPSTSAVRRSRWIGVASSVLTAAAGAAAWRLPQLRYNGGVDPVLAGGYAISSPLAAPFVVAAIVPLVAGVLWSVPGLAAAGRAVATIGWLPLVFAATQTLALLGRLQSSASVPNAGFAAPRWTAGPGLWWAVGGIVPGIAAAVVALLAGRQAREVSVRFPEEDSLARSRNHGLLLAGVLSVVTVVALALPVYRTATTQSPTLLVGFQVNSWGVLALGIGVVVAAFAGGRAFVVPTAIAFPLTGAALMATRLVIPAAVAAQDGFARQGGFVVGCGAAGLFVLAAIWFGISAVSIDFTELHMDPTLKASMRALRASRQASAGRKPSGKRPNPSRSTAPKGSRAAKGRP